MHPFERAGLGIAPFRCIGVEYRVGPIKYEEKGCTVEIGSPGQPMGTCAYCSQGIAECCIIADSTGKKFIVGNVCVGKAAQESSDSKLDTDRKKALKAARAERERTASDELFWRLDNDVELRAVLAAQPHPNYYRAQNGATMLDWALWMMVHAGAAGRTRVRRAVGKVYIPS